MMVWVRFLREWECGVHLYATTQISTLTAVEMGKDPIEND